MLLGKMQGKNINFKTQIYNIDEVKMMSENLFVIVDLHGTPMLTEKKTNYLLPAGSLEAMCILLNYAAKNGTVPDCIDTMNWWERDELQEYLSRDEPKVYGDENDE